MLAPCGCVGDDPCELKRPNIYVDCEAVSKTRTFLLFYMVKDSRREKIMITNQEGRARCRSPSVSMLVYVRERISADRSWSSAVIALLMEDNHLETKYLHNCFLLFLPVCGHDSIVFFGAFRASLGTGDARGKVRRDSTY